MLRQVDNVFRHLVRHPEPLEEEHFRESLFTAACLLCSRRLCSPGSALVELTSLLILKMGVVTFFFRLLEFILDASFQVGREVTSICSFLSSSLRFAHGLVL